jgi:N4-gp56 family major capsid protein
MAANYASSFSADIEAYIADKTLPLARRQLVVYQFGDPVELPKGRGTTYTATRYNRVPLPYAPLAEGVPPVGQQMTIGQVTATCLQWGDRITITDVAELTIKHPLFKKAIELMGLQVAETLERNTFNNLQAFTQINYVNSRGSRAALVAGDVLNIRELDRAYAMMLTLGAPRYSGDELTDTKLAADSGGAKASSNPRAMPHYVMVLHPFVAGDLRENQPIQYAWSHSDINRLYNFELGEWSGIRFCMSNLVPSWTNAGAGPALAASGTGSGFAGATYRVLVTGSDTQNQYESQIYTDASVTPTAGQNITFTTPNLPGYTFSAYVTAAGGGAGTEANLALSSQGPTSGPMQGIAVQLPANTAITLTGIGPFQTPPAQPGTGITVYPNYMFGRGSYAQVMLDEVKFSYLKDADKSDPINQLRIVGWKAFYGTLIQNNQFAMRIESTSSFNSTFG